MPGWKEACPWRLRVGRGSRKWSIKGRKEVLWITERQEDKERQTEAQSQRRKAGRAGSEPERQNNQTHRVSRETHTGYAEANGEGERDQ